MRNCPSCNKALSGEDEFCNADCAARFYGFAEWTGEGMSTPYQPIGDEGFLALESIQRAALDGNDAVTLRCSPAAVETLQGFGIYEITLTPDGCVVSW